MDVMKIKLSTNFMRSIVSKLISMSINKKFGCKVDIQLNDLDIEFIDGEAKVSTNVEVRMSNKEFMKIVKTAGLD